MKQNKIEYFHFFALYFILFIDCALFNSRGFGIGRLFAVLIVVGSIFFSVEKNIFLIAFCLPFSSILKLEANSITVLPILYFIVILKLGFQEKLKFNCNSFFAMGIFLVFQILCCVFYDASLISIISFSLSIMFILVCGKYLNKQEWDNGYLFKNIALFFVGAVCLETFCADIFQQIPYYISAEKHSMLVAAERFAALNIDPNEYAQLVLIALGLIIAVIATIKRYSVKILCFIPLIYLIYKGFFTYSKSYALTLLILIVIISVIFLFKFVKKRGTESLIVIIPLCMFFLIGCYFIYANVLTPIFEKRSTDDLLTGRDEIWLEYLSALFSKIDCLIWGCGISNSTYLVRGLGETHVPHNLYIEYLAQFGFVGLFILGVVLKDVLKNIVNKTKTYMIICILAFAITSFGISANANDAIFFILIIACIPYQQLATGKSLYAENKD